MPEASVRFVCSTSPAALISLHSAPETGEFTLATEIIGESEASALEDAEIPFETPTLLLNDCPRLILAEVGTVTVVEIVALAPEPAVVPALPLEGTVPELPPQFHSAKLQTMRITLRITKSKQCKRRAKKSGNGWG